MYIMLNKYVKKKKKGLLFWRAAVYTFTFLCIWYAFTQIKRWKAHEVTLR